MENKCQTESCETHNPASCAPQECCPVETAMEKWSGAFCDAMHEVQVDILKKKIQGAWGPQMEKVADAVLEAMGIKWQSMLATGKAKVDLRDKIIKVFSEGKR